MSRAESCFAQKNLLKDVESDQQASVSHLSDSQFLSAVELTLSSLFLN